jgi:hypothetical protein
MKTLLLIASLLTANAAIAEVYKCQNAEGKVAFQESPCAKGAGDKMKIFNEGANDIGDPDAQDMSQEVANKYWNLVAQKKITPGMTRKMVLRSWGEPTKNNVTVSTYGRSEQWVYDRGNYVSDYVYIENGRVRSIQGGR